MTQHPRSRLVGVLAGALIASAYPAAADVFYTYDAAGRLVSATYSNGVRIEYVYDASGNRRQIVTSQVVNRPPVAVNDTTGVAASTAINVMVLANDTDPDDDQLSVATVTSVSGGGTAAVQSGGDYVRFTAPSTAGIKTFSYTVQDGAGGTDSATVSVTVTAVNRSPVANPDEIEVVKGTTNTIQVRSNDSDPDGDPLTIVSVTQPSGSMGSVAVSGGTYLVYNAPTRVGATSFNYTVSDGRGGTATATVSVQVVLGEAEEPCTGPGCPIEN